MRKKVNFQRLRKITVNKLNSLVKNEVWLSDLVEEIATEYSSSEVYNLIAIAHRKIKQSDTMVCNIAINNGWRKKRCVRRLRHYDCIVDGKPLTQKLSAIKLFKLKEGNNVNS
jgi:undecaprenyl pyrophosphate synthase|tara:strand:- start:112 stop:450 length:339 start_codon:yes stop_codon:yes gene_type:complete